MVVNVVVKVLVFNESDGNVLVLKRVIHDPNRGGDWDLPGGGVDDREEPGEAVIREAREEAGLNLKSVNLVYGHTATDNHKNILRLCYTAQTNQTKIVISHEHSEYEWLSLDRLIELFNHPVYGVFLKLVRDHRLTPHSK